MIQTGLFPDQPIVEEQLRAWLEPIYPKLWRIIRIPFEDLLERRSRDPAFRILDEGETAQWLRPQIVECARQTLDGDADFRVDKKRQQLFICYKDQVIITPKKLRFDSSDGRLKFSSYPTVQNVDYWRQQALIGMPSLPRLLIGYEFIQEMTEIKIWVAYPAGRDLRDCLLVSEPSGQVKGIFSHAIDPNVEEDDKGFKVVAKNRKKSRKQGQGPEQT